MPSIAIGSTFFEIMGQILRPSPVNMPVRTKIYVPATFTCNPMNR